MKEFASRNQLFCHLRAAHDLTARLLAERGEGAALGSQEKWALKRSKRLSKRLSALQAPSVIPQPGDDALDAAYSRALDVLLLPPPRQGSDSQAATTDAAATDAADSTVTMSSNFALACALLCHLESLSRPWREPPLALLPYPAAAQSAGNSLGFEASLETLAAAQELLSHWQAPAAGGEPPRTLLPVVVSLRLLRVTFYQLSLHAQPLALLRGQAPASPAAAAAAGGAASTAVPE